MGVGYAYVTSQMGTRLTGDPSDMALREALYSAITASSGAGGKTSRLTKKRDEAPKRICRENNFNHNPVVIIGGGVAGLTSANLLARDGFRAVLCEAGSKLGGSCATTTLKGYTFNDVAVYLTIIRHFGSKTWTESG